MTRSLRTLLAGLCTALALAACGASDPAGLVASAKKYLAESNPKSAIIQLKSALQKEPDNAEARFLLAQALLDAGDPVNAETEARKALELRYPDDAVVPLIARAMVLRDQPRTLVNEFGARKLGTPAARADLAASLALAQLRLGDRPAAERLAADAAREAPDDARVLLVRADIASARNDWPAVGRLIDEALAKHPGDVVATVRKAYLLAERGDTDAAVKLLEDAVAANPRVIGVRVTLVSFLIATHKLDAASAQVDKLKELEPKSFATNYADALVSYAKGNYVHARDALQQPLSVPLPSPDVLTLNGLVQIKLGAYAAAEESLTKALARVPNDPNAQRALAQTYVSTGRARLALDLIEPQLRAGSTDAALWNIAGEASVVAGNLTAAADYFTRASELDKQNIDAKVRLAQVRMRTGDTERAMRDLEAIARSEPTKTQADYALISTHMRRREFDQALASAQALVQKQPESAVAYNLVGVVQTARRDLSAARASFDKALSLDPKSVEAARNLAVIDVQQGKADAARARYDAMVAKDPNNESLLIASAELAAVAGSDPAAARSLLERAIRAQPTSARPRLALIALAQAQGDSRLALSAAQDAQAALPRDTRIADALGGAQLAAGNVNQAIETYQRVVADQPQSAFALLRLANAQQLASDLPNAVISARKAVALQPTLGPAWVTLTQLLTKSNKPEAAVAEARRLQADRPREPVGFLLEGEVQSQLKHWPEATAAYRQAYTRSPQPLIASKLHDALLHEGKAQEARTFAAQWNREHPNDATLLAAAARDAMARKDTAGAIAAYRAAVAIDPENFVLLNNLAWQLSLANDPSAREFAERAYNVAPFNPAVLDTYGSVLVAAGDTARGVSLLRMATNLEPKNAEFRLHLGQALAKNGDKTAARKELELVSRLDPQSPLRPDAEKALAQL